MLRHFWGGSKPGGLINDALEEIYRMLEQEQEMFEAAANALMTGQAPQVDVEKEDEDINVGERMVRRLVFEHLTVNPEQDLPASLTLIGIVHDVERIGDYSKSLLELGRLRPSGLHEGGKYASACDEIRNMIVPMIGQTLKALRESDPDLSEDVMRQHREVKKRTDELLEAAMQDTDVHRDAVLYSVGSRFFRRLSAHLSNIASSIANPFDQLGRDA